MTVFRGHVGTASVDGQLDATAYQHAITKPSIAVGEWIVSGEEAKTFHVCSPGRAGCPSKQDYCLQIKTGELSTNGNVQFSVYEDADPSSGRKSRDVAFRSAIEAVGAPATLQSSNALKRTWLNDIAEQGLPWEHPCGLTAVCVCVFGWYPLTERSVHSVLQ